MFVRLSEEGNKSIYTNWYSTRLPVASRFQTIFIFSSANIKLKFIVCYVHLNYKQQIGTVFSSSGSSLFCTHKIEHFLLLCEQKVLHLSNLFANKHFHFVIFWFCKMTMWQGATTDTRHNLMHRSKDNSKKQDIFWMVDLS